MKREEPWSVEDDWIAEEERWFKKEGQFYYPWARRLPRWAVPAGAVVVAALVLLALWAIWVAVPWWTVPNASEAELRNVPTSPGGRRKTANASCATMRGRLFCRDSGVLRC
jgi:hypothetical protein